MERPEQGSSQGCCMNMRQRSQQVNSQTSRGQTITQQGTTLSWGSGQRTECCWHIMCVPFTLWGHPCHTVLTSECSGLSLLLTGMFSQLPAALVSFLHPFVSEVLPSHTMHCLRVPSGDTNTISVRRQHKPVISTQASAQHFTPHR